MSDIDACGLTFSELQELWLGVGPGGSVFNGEKDLRDAWDRGRAVVMRLWGSDGRRPQIWWYLEGSALGLVYPGYFRERSYLYAHNVLTEPERIALEDKWKVEFDAAQAPSFMFHDGGGILTGRQARVAHYLWADIPETLVERWVSARRRRGKKRTGASLPVGVGPSNVDAPEKAVNAPVSVDGEGEETASLSPK